MAITVGDKEVYKIIQNGKLQRVVNKGDKQLFRGDQLKPVLVEKLKADNEVFYVAMIDEDNFIGVKTRYLYTFKRNENELTTTKTIDLGSGYQYAYKGGKLTITTRNNIVWHRDGYVCVFDSNLKLLSERELLSSSETSLYGISSDHTNKNLIVRKEYTISVYDLDYKLIKYEDSVLAMGIFDNTIVKFKKDGFYLEENGQEKKVFNEENNVLDLTANFSANDNYLFVNVYDSNDNRINYLIDKNGILKYRKIVASNNKTKFCQLDNYNAASVFPENHFYPESYRLDFDGNIVYYTEKNEFVNSYTTDKQMFASIYGETSDRDIAVYKNRHLK